jgi:hypothetical protein
MMTPNGDVTVSIDVIAAVISVLQLAGNHGNLALRNALKVQALASLPLSPAIREEFLRDARAEIPPLKTSVDQLKSAAALLLERLTAAAKPCGPLM